MPPPDFEDLTSGLFETCDALLGDTITVTTPSGTLLENIKVHMDMGDARADFAVGAANVQDIIVDIDKALLPSKPDGSYRIALPKRPGVLWAPRDVKEDVSGLRWVFGVKAMANV